MGSVKATDGIEWLFGSRNGDLWCSTHRLHVEGSGRATTGKGVLRFDPSAASGKSAWTNFTAEDGIAHNRIYGVGEAHIASQGLQWMVKNLLTNTIKFTDSGSVTLRVIRSEERLETRNQEDGSSDFESRVSGPYLLVSVTETGKGRPAEECSTSIVRCRASQRALFRRERGSDCRSRNRFQNCWADRSACDSEVGKGTTFTVRLSVEYNAPTSQVAGLI